MSEAIRSQHSADVRSSARFEAALLAFAAGDALGWPQELRTTQPRRSPPVQASVEFHSWTRLRGSRFKPQQEPVGAGEYSDDTQLMLAVARCRASEAAGWWTSLTRTEIPLWTLYERGGGSATKRAAESWLRGLPPWRAQRREELNRYFAAGGNGVAMRVLPHALFHVQHAEAEPLLRDVALDGAATHGHPRALVGACVYAYAAWWLLRASHTVRFGELVEMLLDSHPVWGAMPLGMQTPSGWSEAAASCHRDYAPVWNGVVTEMRTLLASVRRGLSAGVLANDDDVLRSLDAFGAIKGAGTVTAAAALYLCARHAARPAQGVLKAAFSVGLDTDTVAAMTAALLGCMAGGEWLPLEWSSVQDAGYVKQLAGMLAETSNGSSEQIARPGHQRSVAREDLTTLQRALASGVEDVDLDGVRRARIDHRVPQETTVRDQEGRWRLLTNDGQTLYIVKAKQAARQNKRPEPFAFRVDEARQRDLAAAQELPEVRLEVHSIEASARFYEVALGLKPREHRPGVVVYGSLSLVEGEPSMFESMARDNVQQGLPGLVLSVRVRDIKAARQRVKELHSCVVQDIALSPRGETMFVCLDPDGHRVEVISLDNTAQS